MKVEQQLLAPSGGWQKHAGGLSGVRPQLVLAFGGRPLLEQPFVLVELRRTYPGARVLLASTAGEITDMEVTDHCISVTAIAFERSHIAGTTTSVRNQWESFAAGRQLAQRLRAPGLVHVFAISDGQLVNGTELARGFNETLPAGVTLTGGLAGDGERFERTVVGLDEVPDSGRIAAVGFYGAHLKVGFGSSGGWTEFGPERVVTAADGNILFQLDGQPALDVYRQQLGKAAAAALPASALSFPLSVAPPGVHASVMRAVLAVDDGIRSLMFAGDIPVGSRVRFMQASHADLMAGAADAAHQSRLEAAADLAICVSCVGRRVVLGERTADEIKSVRRVVGAKPVIAGFYSYGELAPAGTAVGCQLHNQTMTITTLQEH